MCPWNASDLDFSSIILIIGRTFSASVYNCLTMYVLVSIPVIYFHPSNISTYYACVRVCVYTCVCAWVCMRFMLMYMLEMELGRQF